MISAPEALRRDAQSALDGLPALVLAAERLAATVLPGAHGLRRAGAGEDFWQYRAASAGDSLRMIDWRRSARSDAEFVRDRERQTAQAAMLWVSDGLSMDYAGAPDRPSKGSRARTIALALGIALIRGHERVAVLGQGAARPGRSQITRLAHGLSLPGPGTEDAAPPVTALRPHQRVVLISDFLGDPAPVQAFLAQAAGMGVGGAIVQVLDPDEEVFPFSGAILFQDISGARRHDTRDAAGLRREYLDRLAQRRALLAETARKAGWHFTHHDTAAAPATALMWLYSVLGQV
ncbi:DUF58 domain-containing protein [Paracoccus pacificus]|uniref:DUF58 domain-containing protein n=1 Tax=Paracoccus pacificus TaxID=1463598 RepID=A0ABW4R4G5_9RHOB